MLGSERGWIAAAVACALAWIVAASLSTLVEFNDVTIVVVKKTVTVPPAGTDTFPVQPVRPAHGLLNTTASNVWLPWLPPSRVIESSGIRLAPESATSYVDAAAAAAAAGRGTCVAAPVLNGVVRFKSLADA